MKPAAAKYVVLTNIVALLGVVFTLSFGPMLLLTGSLFYPAMQVVYSLGYLPVLLLNHLRMHRAATLWLLLGGQVLVVAQVLVDGTGFDVQLFFMIQALLPFLLLPPWQTRTAFVLSAIAGVLLLAVIVSGNQLVPLGPVIPHWALLVFRPVLAGGLFATIVACSYYARRATFLAEDAFQREHQRSEDLLLNILPPSIADRLKATSSTIADGFGNVTVLFADIVGFTTMSARLSPERVVEMLNELFSQFDDIAGRLGLEKIKTIGDCYMVAGGLPTPRPDHAEAVADMALAMVRVTAALGSRVGEPIRVRIGLHSGPVVAGVIGKRKFIYDLWGDTVNTASRMESHGLPGAIQISEATQQQLVGKFRLTSRGIIDVKGKGPMPTWFVEERLEVAEPVAKAG